MDYQKLIIEIPPFSDESAATLKRFMHQLLHAVDEHYHAQIHQHHLHSLLQEGTLVDVKDELTDPPF